jgi:hypothetical protein
MKSLFFAAALLIPVVSLAETNEQPITIEEFEDFFQYYTGYIENDQSYELHSTLCTFVSFPDEQKKQSICKIAEAAMSDTQGQLKLMLEKHPRLTKRLHLDMLILKEENLPK